MTVDCEEWFHAANVDSGNWNILTQTVQTNTMKLLELFARYSATATFFTLGDVAERHPYLIETITQAGHRIASHGYGHKSINRLTPDEFRETIVKSKNILEQCSGKIVTAYRAPNFSITKESAWALDILCDSGYTLDSSIAPIHNYRYGISEAKPHIHTIQTSTGILTEVPVGTLQPINPIALLGGFYFRFFPVKWTLQTLELNERSGKPSCFYIHPWEVTTLPDDALVPSRFQSIRMRHNLDTTYRKLEHILREYSFGAITV